jgi:hypothetical protein
VLSLEKRSYPHTKTPQTKTPGLASLFDRPEGPKPIPAPAAFRMTLAGANPKATVTGLEELPGKSNYFIGNDPTKWRTNVPTCAKVKYQNVYRGIDLVYYGTHSNWNTVSWWRRARIRKRSRSTWRPYLPLQAVGNRRSGSTPAATW